ncbi:MAG: DNA helicase II, partial [Chloroflexota bacterium]
VGITRARRMLYLANARSRTVFGNTQSNMPSRFLSDIPEQLLSSAGSGSRKFIPSPSSAWGNTQPSAPPPERPEVCLVVGRQVRHNIFGLGTVLKANADGRPGIVVVRFADARGKPIEKTLDTAFAKLEEL